jgi:hypothetical protein
MRFVTLNDEEIKEKNLDFHFLFLQVKWATYFITCTNVAKHPKYSNFVKSSLAVPENNGNIKRNFSLIHCQGTRGGGGEFSAV